MCGVIKQFLAVIRGFCADGGSVESTSRHAPAIFPVFKASARSASLISPPLPVLVAFDSHLLMAIAEVAVEGVRVHQWKGTMTLIQVFLEEKTLAAQRYLRYLPVVV